MRALVAALLASLLAPVSAWAHQAAGAFAPRSASLEGAAISGPATSVVLVAALAAGVGLTLSRRRLALGLAFMLLVLGFETGLHSTHHLGESARAPECAVAAATAHLTGGSVERVSVDPLIVPSYPVPSERPVQVPRRRPASHEGRAPPAAIA
jgi:hypothetical protein